MAPTLRPLMTLIIAASRNLARYVNVSFGLTTTLRPGHPVPNVRNSLTRRLALQFPCATRRLFFTPNYPTRGRKWLKCPLILFNAPLRLHESDL